MTGSLVLREGLEFILQKKEKAGLEKPGFGKRVVEYDK